MYYEFSFFDNEEHDITALKKSLKIIYM